LYPSKIFLTHIKKHNMDKKETYVAVIGIIVVGILCFFGGILNQKSREQPLNKADYQIVLQEHEYIIMDGNRVVGVVLQTGQLDSLIMADNQ
jgi:hypothetical protein